MSSSESDKSSSVIGRTIGGCLIESLIGKGAMGAVYRATHIRLSKTVALKLLPKDLIGDKAMVDRFVREARAAARLEHHNIVQVLDVNRDRDYYYIVMQFVDGKSLGVLLQAKGKISWKPATRVVREVAVGLAAAHDEGVFHRDIKPDNILISRKKEVKIADFGLARATGMGSDITIQGQMIGTPYYMAPEQIQGRDVDGRTDIYGLGVTYYYMLTGRRPFEGASVQEVIIAQLRATAPAPHTLDQSIPRQVSRTVMKMLEKPPDKRFPDCTSLVKHLDRLLATDFAPEGPPSFDSSGLLPLPAERYLRVEQAGRERLVPLAFTKPSFVVGRGPECDLQLPGEKRASLQHFELALVGDDVRLCDLGSALGTRVNGRPVAAAARAAGDVITVGETRLTFLFGDPRRNPSGEARAPQNAAAAPAPGGASPAVPPGPAPLPKIIFLGILEGQRDAVFEVPPDLNEITVGRASDNAIALPQTPEAARNHCRIVRYRGDFHLIDGGSRYGTRVNGERVEKAKLNWGDEIAIGEARIFFGERKSISVAGSVEAYDDPPPTPIAPRKPTPPVAPNYAAAPDRRTPPPLPRVPAPSSPPAPRPPVPTETGAAGEESADPDAPAPGPADSSADAEPGPPPLPRKRRSGAPAKKSAGSKRLRRRRR
ncbi:MAG: protein kinase [Planctomycetes bacterium]|nr:protein kinase [Planctomycetota bacterium]